MFDLDQSREFCQREHMRNQRTRSCGKVRYAEREQRLRHMKEEVWELFGRQPSLRPRTREEFDEEFRRRVLSGVFSSSKEEQEKDLQKWLDELQKVAQVEEWRLEARRRKEWAKKTLIHVAGKLGTRSSSSQSPTYSLGKPGASAEMSLQSTDWTRSCCLDTSLRERPRRLSVDRHVPPKPSHSILNTGTLRSTHLRVHHVCGAEHAVFLRRNTHGSKREHAIREFIGARLVVDVLPPRVVLVLVINSWFTLSGYTIPFNLFIIAWWFGVFAKMADS